MEFALPLLNLCNSTQLSKLLHSPCLIAKSSLSPNDTDGEIHVMKNRTLHEELCELMPKNYFILTEK
ncbi:hypothetical protein LguiB_008006 [Lonicera macranthoides]